MTQDKNPRLKRCISAGIRSSAAPTRAAAGAIGLGVLHEIGVAEGEAPVGEVVDRPLPADHAVGVVLEDQHDEVQLQPDRRLQFLGGFIMKPPSPQIARTRRCG